MPEQYSEVPEAEVVNASAPLAGVRILEVGTVVMAPYAGKILVDLGGDVIKVEPPGGDIGKFAGPMGKSLSYLSLSLNAGKRSIVLDARDSDDREVVIRLVEWADVVVTNLLPGRRQEFGLDWHSVSAIDPSTILITGQGFASESEEANRPAYDDITQAASGVADTYRLRDGEPRYSPYLVADKVCGMTMAQAAMAALFQRTKTGRGQWVDVPMVDTMAAFTLLEHLGEQTVHPYTGKTGWPRVIVPEHKPLRANDGWVCVMPYTDSNWKQFCELIDRPDYIDRPDLATNSARSSQPQTYEAILAEYASTRSCEQIEEECSQRRIPVQRVNRIDDLASDSYLSKRPMLREANHSLEGKYTHVGTPMEFYGLAPVQTRECSTPDADRNEILEMLCR